MDFTTVDGRPFTCDHDAVIRHGKANVSFWPGVVADTDGQPVRHKDCGLGRPDSGIAHPGYEVAEIAVFPLGRRSYNHQHAITTCPGCDQHRAERQRDFMRAKRAADPERAREQNRKDVAAYRARKKAESVTEEPIETP